ncbi:MAG: T9SS type A sorting domain-containing protein [Rhizobacter sp.]|nr:T9SS type A sorting domain-containing protein [Ferruginibacter sp.]
MQQLHLSIPEPCHENWNEMSPNEQGRFCNSCAKTVVDFSAMTDAQLLFYFENLKNENVCGHVYKDQLDRSIKTLPLPRKKIFAYWQYFLAFFMMLGKGQPAKAQGQVKGEMVARPDTVKNPSNTHIRLGKIRSLPLPYNTSVIGAALPHYFITDEKNQPIGNASVQMLPMGKWIAADSSGKITLGKQHKVQSLLITALGFENRLVVLKDLSTNTIQLLATEQVLEEITLTSTPIQPKYGPMENVGGMLGGLRIRAINVNSVEDSIQDLFRKNSLSIFPNPVLAGGTSHFALQLKQPGYFVIQITDVGGHIMMRQSYSSASKKTSEQVMIPANWSAGVYFATVTNEKGKKIGAGKLIIE